LAAVRELQFSSSAVNTPLQSRFRITRIEICLCVRRKKTLLTDSRKCTTVFFIAL